MMAQLADLCLHEVRARKGLSQRRLAQLAGIHVVTLNRIERGRRPCGFGVLVKLADALGMPREQVAAHVARSAQSPTPA